MHTTKKCKLLILKYHNSSNYLKLSSTLTGFIQDCHLYRESKSVLVVNMRWSITWRYLSFEAKFCFSNVSSSASSVSGFMLLTGRFIRIFWTSGSKPMLIILSACHTDKTLLLLLLLLVLLWSPYGIGHTIIFSSCGHSSSFFSFPCLISAVADRMSAILPHMVWP